jgi:Uma2 family endonuclease
MHRNRRHPYFTHDEYLAIEKISPIKHEYLQGQVIAIAGFSKAHVIIVGNFSTLIINHLRGMGCISYATDMKVYLPSLNLFYYPDLTVTCDECDHTSTAEFILYPKLIIEVLSDSTEAFDRGDKLSDYKTISTLEEYILVHQSQILVERFQRKSNNLWTPQIFQSGDTLTLSSINFTCEIEALYENLDQLSSMP